MFTPAPGRHPGGNVSAHPPARSLSAAQLDNLVELAPDGIFVADSAGRYTYVNEAGAAMLGYAREDLIGTTIADLIPPDEISRLWSEKSELLGGEIKRTEWTLRRKDGAWLPVEVSAKILPDGQWQAFVRDISMRKAHEAERDALFRQVENDRQRLQTIIDTVPMGMLLFLPGSTISFNRRAEELLGMKLSAAGGSAQYVGRILYPDGRPVPQEALPSSRALREGTTFYAEEFVVERPDGTRIQVLGNAAPIRDADGRVVGCVGAFQDVSEHHRAEEVIRSKQRLLQAIFDILPVGVWVADRSGHLIQTNPAGERIWAGVRYVALPEYGQYKGWWADTGKPIAPEEWGMARAITKGETSTQEMIRIQCFDGSYKTICHYAMPLRSESGEIDGGVVVIEDITKLHEEQEKRRASERLLRMVFELLPVGVWIADRSGRIVQNNPAGERIWGGKRHVGIPEFGQYKGWWADTCKPIAAEEWALARALARGETSTGELVCIQCFDGSFKTIINSAMPLVGETGEIEGAIVVNEDVTALNELQQKHRAGEALLRTVIDLLPVGLWLADRDGRITLSNPAGDRIWHGTRYVGPEHFGDYRGWRLDTGEAIAPQEWGLSRAVQRGEISRDELLRIQCFDGSFKTVVNFAAPIRSATGEITGAIAVNEDITALQHTQDQLRAAVTDRESILAMVSHDLRNPLAVILAGLRAVARETQRLAGAERVEALAATLLDSAQRMSGLIDDLLAVATAHMGRSMLTLAPVPAGDLLARAVAAARPLFERRSIRLEARSGERLPTLNVDVDRVLRVFGNLTDNAAKFTPYGGHVVVSAETVAGGVQYSVANSGAPLPADQLEQMFQPFWQGGRVDARGAGLGLSICRSIMEAHGGTIWAEPAEGYRVRVCFVLPVADAIGGTRGEVAASGGGAPPP